MSNTVMIPKTPGQNQAARANTVVVFWKEEVLGSEQATGSERVSLVPANPASITDKVLNAGGQAEQGS